MANPANLSDTEDDIAEMEDEEEEARLEASIKKDLFSEFDTETPMKLSRISVSHTREPMKVYLRVRPFTKAEVENGESQECMTIENCSTLMMRAPENSFAFKSSQRGFCDMTHKFTFSSIFDQDTSQKTFFDDTMLGTVKDFIDGQNCLVFTYGVTNAGKTYTIQGEPQDGGILPRSLDVVFNSIENRQFSSTKLKPRYFCDVFKLSEKQQKKEMEVKASVLALGNVPSSTTGADQTTMLEGESMTEDSLDTDVSRASYSSAKEDSCQDVLSESKMSTTKDLEGLTNQTFLDEINARIPEDTMVNVDAQGQVKFSVWVSFAEIYNQYIYDLLEPLPKGKKARRQVLKLAEDKHGSIYIKGLKEIQVSTADEAYRILKIGQRNLSIAATKLNHVSSRSHCIFSVKILRVVDVNDPHVARVSQLSFCDLAGSERYTRTQNTGDRLKEAGNINTSLLTLGKCITALRYNQNHPKSHPKIIPFRESKLTRLFQSFFLGKGKASMVVNVNQCASGFDETMHVLKFSAIAKQVTTVTSKLDNKWQEPPVKKASRPLRNVSLALNQALDMKVKGQRPSVPWATPGTITQVMKETGHVPALEDTVFEEEEEEYDDEEEEEEEMDSDTADTPVPKRSENSSKVQKDLLAVIEVLKQKLVEEKVEKCQLETKIRKEVCEEMAQQLVEIEQDYNEQLEEDKQRAEEAFEKRLEIYAQSVNKSRKRARPDDDSSDAEQVPSSLLAAAQKKIKDQEAKIDKLTDDLAYMEQSLKDAEERRSSEVKELSKTIADQQEKLHIGSKTKEDELKSAKDNFEAKVEELTSSIGNLQKALQEKEEGLKEKEKEIARLTEEVEGLSKTIADQQEKVSVSSKAKEDELTSAKDDFKAEVEELTSSIGNMQKAVQEKDEGLKQKEKEILDLREQVKGLSKTIADQQEKVSVSSKAKEDELTSAKNDFKAEVEELTSSIGSLQKAVQEKEDGLKEKEKEIARLTEQVEGLSKTIADQQEKVSVSSKAKEDELTSAKNDFKAEVEELTSSIGSLQKAVQEKEEGLEQKEKEIARLTEQVEGLSKTIADQQEKVSVSSKAKEDELTSAKNDFKAEVEELTSSIGSLQKAVQEKEEGLKQKEKEIARLTEQKNKELEKHGSLVHNLEERIEALAGAQKQLEDANKEIGEKDAQLEDLHRQLEEQKDKVKQTEETMATQEEELNMSIGNLQKVLQEKEEHLKQKEEKIVHLREQNNKEFGEHGSLVHDLEERIEALAGAQKQLEDANKEIGEREAQLEDLYKQLEEQKDKVKQTEESMATQVEELTSSIGSLQKAVQEKEEGLKEKEKEIVDLTTQVKSKKNKELEEVRSRVHELEKRVDTMTDAQKQLGDEKDAQLEDLYKQLEEQKDKVKQTEETMATQLCAEMKSNEEAQQELRNTILKLTDNETELKELLQEAMASAAATTPAASSTTTTTSSSTSTEEEEGEEPTRRTMKGMPSTTSLASTVSTFSTTSYEEEDDEDIVVIEQEDQKGFKAGRRSRVEIDATPLQKKNSRKGRTTRATKTSLRASKRRGGDKEDHEEVTSKKAKGEEGASSRTRSRTQRRPTRTNSVHEEIENQPQDGESPSVVSQSGSSQRRGPLARINEYLQNSPIGKTAKRIVDTATGSVPATPDGGPPSPSSPPKPVEMATFVPSLVPEGKQKRKRKLYKTDISAPYECSPFEIVNLGEAKPTEGTGAVITRKLRSRTKKN